MNLYDALPFARMLPRRFRDRLALLALAVLVIVPAARDWMIDQAVQHVTNKVEPMVTQITDQASPSTDH